MQKWKEELKAVMDNPNYIEEKIKAIQFELEKEHPNTDYIREKVEQLKNWLNEIDLAHQRAMGAVKKVI